MISFCPDCGKSIQAAFKFCPYCGNSLPIEEHVGSETSVSPHVSSFQGSKRGLNSSLETSPKKVKWSSTITSPRLSLFSDGDSSESEDTLSSSERSKGSGSRPPTPKSSPQKTSCSPQKTKQSPQKTSCSPQKTRQSPQTLKRSPQTLKRSRVTTSLEALPTGTVLTDKSGRQWKLKFLQTRDDQGILYEAAPTSALACDSGPQKQKFSLKLQDAKDGRLFNEQNFFQRAAKPLQVNKWKKLYSTPRLAVPTCMGFGVHQDKYRFLVLPSLGRSLQSALDVSPEHVLSERSVLQVACRLLDALEFLHENEYVHGNVTAENIFVDPEDQSQVTLAGYGFAFRYCPSGKHVAYVEGSRSPHEGDLEFISMDLHKGCGPSRRSDLQSLGYCMLKWLYGFLPWTNCFPNTEDIMKQKQKLPWHSFECKLDFLMPEAGLGHPQHNLQFSTSSQFLRVVDSDISLMQPPPGEHFPPYGSATDSLLGPTGPHIPLNCADATATPSQAQRDLQELEPACFEPTS
ncbi:inactive serine/threonine-protein kinase VRK3 isoform X4 [Trachypithecus francoisi]|uniref:inactive serine/threonine-protein kinase VRK3 isoform X4 n=1 Tax=Trachypithecus francoisi TaxID=54180 RepID=UPI00141B4250|nr:inactive serine/threonine-protein kinase VRK3 isoform X4 [Trachypithecus francoisi]XP_033080070.1 inactive serine/threonine-protein kinase VRK3 isoform X4 [Trachypithecus francoisi]XP_033080071.1 inactive serine/threonine-protein kinase VRK3 isoform X4 [Trachypithecus francoisi]XP_033080072.1 inactive serine/threonine-protein kinase VRK3 isoform X4 [Trachypithecus francoisi]XP_033080073.1 inactive serine/threonine-protein kinase VRK3 isoform X4 [Trachypithecus francoisi]